MSWNRNQLSAKNPDKLRKFRDPLDRIIPQDATQENQLVDKKYVNEQIVDSDDTYRGTSAKGLTLQQFLAWANSLEKNINDYVFWDTLDDQGNRVKKRYKFNGEEWVYEYDENAYDFTEEQLAAINSGVTSQDKDKLSALPTNTELNTLLGGKVDNEDGKGLSTNDYTNADKEKLANLPTSAELEIQLDGKADESDLSSLEGSVEQLQQQYQALTQSDIIVGSLPLSGVANKIYRVPGTTDYSDYMWYNNDFVLMATYDNAIDDTPTANSNNLVKSGGIKTYVDGHVSVSQNTLTTDNKAKAINVGGTDYNITDQDAQDKISQLGQQVIYDVSAHNSGATFASLSALLSDADLANLIPTGVRCGGMSIRFVQTSDNKYVQYRLMADDWSINTEDWAIVDEGVYVENPEFVYVETDAVGKILWAIKTDGGIYYGAGCPQQVKEYIEEKIADLSLDEYDNIVTFLSDYLGSDTTLKALIDSKLNAEGLDPEALATVQVVENPEYIQVATDSKDKVLEGITSEGVKQINLSIDTPSATIEHIESPEWISVATDSKKKILGGRKQDGTVVENVGIEANYVNTDIANIHTLKAEELQFNSSIGNVLTVDTLEVDEGVVLSDDARRKLQDDIINNELPEYWNTYINTKESEINLLLKNTGNHGDLFVFFSDYHYVENTRYTPKIIRLLCKKIGNLKIINGGDILNTHATYNISMGLLESFNKSFYGLNLYNVFGNHDNNPYGPTEDSRLSIDSYYPLLFKNLEERDNVSLNANGYYYVDNKLQKIRYIVLNTYNNGIYTNEPEHITQLDWFVSTLNDVEAGWYVVVISHIFYEVYYNQELQEYYVAKACGALISAITDAYQTKQAGSKNGYSFDFTNAKGKMAGILTGHVHYDYSEQSETGYPIICIEQDAIDYPGNMPELTRERGTYTEQAFDIVSIDIIGKTIKTVRIGAGENRNFSFE